MRKLLAALAFLATAGAAEAQTAGCGGIYANCADGIGGTSIASAQITVGTVATLVAARREFRQSVAIENTTTNQIFCGPAGVTTTTGHLLPGAVGAVMNITTQAAVYCVSATSSVVTEMEAY